jgi:hypothetical protein
MASPAAAQNQNKGYSRYTPARPTISPYNELFRPETGPLPNYHQYVRPLQQQIAVNKQQQAVNRQQAVFNTEQDTGLRNVQQGFRQLQTGTLPATGIGGTFRNFSHYYPGLAGP